MTGVVGGTERRSRNIQIQRFLAEAGTLLTESLNYEETLDAVCRLAVPLLADWCSVNLIEPDGRIARVGLVHADPAREPILQQIRDLATPGRDSDHPLAVALRGGETRLFEHVSDEDLRSFARDERHLALERELGTRSVIIAAMTIRERLIGAITLGMADSGRTFMQQDVVVAEDLARRAAVAIDNARLYREARLAEERLRSQAARLQALAEASTALANAQLDLDAVLETIAEQVVRLVGDICIIRLVTDDGLWVEPVVTRHRNPEAHALLRQLPGSGRRSIGDGAPGRVLTSGEPLLVTGLSRDEMIEYVRESYRPYVERFGLHSILIVPLRARGRVIGTLGGWRDDPSPPYTEDDLTFVQDIADRAALAVDNARLYAEARDATRRALQFALQLSGLADAAVLVNSALTMEQVLETVTDQAQQIIGARRARTIMTQPGNWADAVVSMSPKDTSAVQASVARDTDMIALFERVCASNTPVRLSLPELGVHFTGSLESPLPERRPQRGWLAAPLVGRDGRNIGLIDLCDKLEGEFTETDLSILIQFAHMASEAIENARLYRAAQDAIAARDEFLSVAAHELKTPITSLRGYAQLLLRQFDRTEALDPNRLRRGLGAIDYQSSRLVTLVEQLLDTSRIQSGHLAIVREPSDVAQLIDRVIAAVATTTTRHTFQTRGDRPLIADLDPLRIEQVLINLLDNAVKYSPDGGTIVIEAGASDGELTISVTDQGIGIPEDKRALVMERFYQAHDSRQFGGMGLGLYISRQILQLHGGSLELQQPDAGGTRAIVRLPIPSA